MAGKVQHGWAARRAIGRWHVSTVAWLVVVFLLLVVVIVPGRTGPMPWQLHEMHHGWPFVYAIRDVGGYEANPWDVTDGLEVFDVLPLLGDLCLCVLALGAVGWWAERRARRKCAVDRQLHAAAIAWRLPRPQFRLTTLLVAPLVCGVPLTYWLDHQRLAECKKYEDLFSPRVTPHWLRPLEYAASLVPNGDLQDGRWRRSTGGLATCTVPDNDETLEHLLYLVRCYPRETLLTVGPTLTGEQTKRLSALREIRCLRLCDVQPGIVPRLEEFSNVEYLCVEPIVGYELSQPPELGVFPYLRNLTRLRSLGLYGQRVDDAQLLHLANLADLEELQLTRSQRTCHCLGHETELRHDARMLDDDQRRITDAGLARLSHLKRLVRLRLEGTQITGPGLAYLHGLPRLRHLSLQGAPLTNEGLAAVNGCRALISLDVSDTPLSTLDGLDWDALPNLRRVNVSGTDISRQALNQLRSEHPQVRIEHDFYDRIEAVRIGTDELDGFKSQGRHISVCHRINAEMLQCLASLSHVSSLSLTGSNIVDENLAFIGKMVGLRTLHLDRTRITSDALLHLRDLHQLEELNLSGTYVDDLQSLAQFPQLKRLVAEGLKLNGRSLDGLRGLTQLEDLYLSNTSVSDEALSSLAGLTSLTSLDLSGTEITDAGLASLAPLTQLRRLSLHRTGITGSGLAHLSGLRSLETIYLDSTVADDDTAIKSLKTFRPERICLYDPDRPTALAAVTKLSAALPEVLWVETTQVD